MKRLTFLLFLTIFSCDYFEKKKLKTEDIVSQELETMDWNVVDQYPSFSVCDSVSEKQERKQCFENTILTKVNAYLSQQNIVVSEDVEDTITIKLQIDKTGDIFVLDVITKPETKSLIPEIDSLIFGSIKTLPKIFPAIKRGQQVTTEFVLPVVVSIQ